MKVNKLTINMEKTEYVNFSKNMYKDNLELDNFILKKVENYNYLGCIIDSNLNFDLHIKSVEKQIKKYTKALNICVSNNFKKSVYSAFVLSYLNYSLTIWGEKDTSCLKKLQLKIINRYKIKNVLLLDKLYSYRKIALVRNNKFNLEHLNLWEKYIYYKYALVSDDDFRILYSDEKFNDTKNLS